MSLFERPRSSRSRLFTIARPAHGVDPYAEGRRFPKAPDRTAGSPFVSQAERAIFSAELVENPNHRRHRAASQRFDHVTSGEGGIRTRPDSLDSARYRGSFIR